MADHEPKNSAIRRAPITGDVVGRLPRQFDEDDGEGPSRADIERFNNTTQNCPKCGKEIFDDVIQCYHCGHALMSRQEPKGNAAWLVVIVVTLVIVISGLIAFLRP